MQKPASLLLVFCLYAARIFSQGNEIKLRHYSVNDGLSQSSVYSFLQDTKGFIWIATGDGLNKFDGYNFTTFKRQNNDLHSISNNTIRSILEDSAGKIWIGTEIGLNVYDPTNGKITRYPMKDITFPSEKSINVMGFRGNELMLWRRREGILAYNIIDHTSTPISAKDSTMAEVGFIRDGKYQWFVNLRNEICRFNITDKKTDCFPIPFSSKGNSISAIRNFENGHIVICATTGIWDFNSRTGKCVPFSPLFNSKSARDIIRDEKGNYYVAIENEGLFIYSPDWKLLKSYKDDFARSSKEEFSLRHITRFFMDRSGNIWFGTDGSGAFIISRNQIKFTHVNNETITPFRMEANFIKCFYKDEKGILWVGTLDHGLYKINRKTGEVHSYAHSDKDRFSILHNEVTSILNDSGGLWIGTQAGLCFFDFKTERFTPVQQDPKPDDHKVTCCYRTKHGETWICTQGTVYKLVKGTFNKLEKMPIMAFPKTITEHNGDYLVGTNGAGYRIQHNDQTIFPPLLKEKALEHANVQCFHVDKNDNIWAATDAGLLKLSSSYKFIHLFDTHEGLPDNYIYGILEDKNGKFWLSTNRGISQFDPASEKFRNFTLEDGIQSFEFNTGAFYKASDGEMFFGGINGINYFYPESIPSNRFTPTVALTDFKVFDENVPLDSAIESKKIIILPYDKNTFSFEFAGIEFSNPSQNQYASRLEGLEAQWYNSGNRRFVKYSSLKPGIYHLWLKASNNDGAWSQPRRMITIYILSPYWQSWWFITLAVLALIAVTILIVRYFLTRKLQKRLQALERRNEIEKIRNRISRDIHDDIGSGLTKISMMSQMARMDITKNKNIDDKLNTLSSSARDLSERLQEIVWAMNPRHDDLASLLTFLRSYASDFFESSEIKLTFNFPNDIPFLPLNPDMRRNLFLCFKEALNNIAKYASASEIVIETEITNNLLHLRIIDNGKGFDPAKNKKSGNGLLNMQKRMEEINGKFTIQSEEGKGTVININFPV